ncbi:MAG: anti-sigma factor antagonist [Gammaproteobacteria bacterium]|nr:MAG: anti-sigma factor antagonist [Gammaproteobacteria bacterium]
MMLTIHDRQRTGQCSMIRTLKPEGCLNYECLIDLVHLLGASAHTGMPIGAVVLDLADTRYVDSSGIAALLHIVRHMPGAGRLQVVHCNPQLDAIFRQCHLDRWVVMQH